METNQTKKPRLLGAAPALLFPHSIDFSPNLREKLQQAPSSHRENELMGCSCMHGNNGEQNNALSPPSGSHCSRRLWRQQSSGQRAVKGNCKSLSATRARVREASLQSAGDQPHCCVCELALIHIVMFIPGNPEISACSSQWRRRKELKKKKTLMRPLTEVGMVPFCI